MKSQMRFGLVFFVLLLALLCCACSESDDDNSGGDADTGGGDSDLEQGSDGDTDADLEQTDTDAQNDGDMEAEIEAQPESFKVAIISDTHLVLNEEDKSNLNFVAFGQMLEDMEEKPDFVINTGDLVDDLFCFPDRTCEDPLDILTIYRSAIEENYSMPIYQVLGNHDNRYFDSWSGNDAPLASWDFVFGETGMFPAPYYSIEHNGFLFVVLFAGEMATDHDSNDRPTFSEEQLGWLEDELSKEMPTFLFWHHYIEPEQEMLKDNPSPLLDVIDRHSDTILATFGGHGHRFMHKVWQGVHFYETDALARRDPLVHHMLKCDPNTKSFEILNSSDIEYSR